MDWPVTARTQVAHVRQTIADRELEAWLAVDLSASLDFGTANSTKRDLAIAAAAAVAHLTVRGGNRIGAVIGNGATVVRLPARPGRTEAQGLLRAIARTPSLPGRTDLGALIDGLNRPPPRRGPPAAAHQLRLAARHREVRRRRPAREDQGVQQMIRFLSPWWLLALLPVIGLAGAYVWRQRRRRAVAVRFSNVELLRSVAPG